MNNLYSVKKSSFFPLLNNKKRLAAHAAPEQQQINHLLKWRSDYIE